MSQPRSRNCAMNLQLEICDRNFREPIKFETNPFLDEVNKWKPNKPLPSISRVSAIIKFQEIDNNKAFNAMVTVLKKAQYWAIDLEHCNDSYSGTTCLIQISTDSSNFLIDPLPLYHQIKSLLKPLLESGDHVKVMHGCFNDVKWLQRDFHIFVWPVIDTQIIYRDIKKHQNIYDVEGVPNLSNISLGNLIRQYFPHCAQKDNSARADFRQRPLPTHLKEYAVRDTVHLIPILVELKHDLESHRKSACRIEELYQSCAVYIAKRALYQGKCYPSAVDVMTTYKIEDTGLFKELHKWRDDLARALDVPPEILLCSPNLMMLSRICPNSNWQQIHKFTKKSNLDSLLTERDSIAAIQRIIDERNYSEFRKCTDCNHHKYNLAQPDMLAVTSHRKVYLSPLKGEPLIVDTPKYLWYINKLPFTICSKIELFGFSSMDLGSCINDIIILCNTVMSMFECSFCSKIVANSLVFPCANCSSVSICCKSCWQSMCPECGLPVYVSPVTFEPADRIVKECLLFEDSVHQLHCAERLPAIVDLFNLLEIETMCDFCFRHIEETMVVKKLNESVRCCRGCDKAYMEIYGRYKDPIPFKKFDELGMFVTGMLSKILDNFQCNKVPLRDDIYKKISGIPKEESVQRKMGISKLEADKPPSTSYCTII